jgi:glycerate dehydrogenase
MEVYIINPKDEFSGEQLREIAQLDKVIYIEKFGDLYRQPYMDSNEEKIIGVSPDYTDWQFSNDLINKIPNVRALCLATTAYDYIDVDFCKKKDILVTNIPKYAGNSVAEYLFFLAMCLAKKLPLQLKNNNKQDFSDIYKQELLKNKVVGIIGLGDIGTKIANICCNFGMEVVYWSKNSRNNKFLYKELKDLFSISDFIFNTLLINNETRKIVTIDLINKMKKTANYISGMGINIDNHKLILKKAANNELFGYAFEEPNKVLGKYKGNVMVTSEYAWFTKEATYERFDKWIETIKSVIEGYPINLVL